MSILEGILAWNKKYPHYGRPGTLQSDEALEELLDLVKQLANNVEGCDVGANIDAVNLMWLNPTWKENFLCLEDEFECLCGEDHPGSLDGMHDILSAVVKPAKKLEKIEKKSAEENKISAKKSGKRVKRSRVTK